jgi:hypothetical protein
MKGNTMSVLEKLDEDIQYMSKDLVQALPKQVQGSISNEVLDRINEVIASDNYMKVSYRDNLLGFSNVLKDNKFKLPEYLNAVRYVSYRLMGLGIHDSYIRTFPDRYQRLLAEGADAKYMSSFSSAYNKTKIVTTLMEQSLVPTYVLNQDLFQEAINAQAAIMRDTSVSPKVRSDAANSLMTHLKQPEKAKIEMDIKVNEGKAIDDLREATRALAQAQLKAITEGEATVIDVAHSTIVNRDNKE